MSFLKSNRFIKCQQNEDGSVECMAYRPTKDGKKLPVATIKGQMTPECTLNLLDQDGDPSEIAKLEEHLGKRAMMKCKSNNSEI